MRAYLIGGGISGTEEYSGVYHLVTADGICWASQWCSSFEQARKDLYEERAGMKADWAKKYDGVEVFRLGDDAMTFDRLLAREMNYNPAPTGKLADGVYFNIITVKNGVMDKSEPKPINALAALVANTIIEKFDK